MIKQLPKSKNYKKIDFLKKFIWYHVHMLHISICVPPSFLGYQSRKLGVCKRFRLWLPQGMIVALSLQMLINLYSDLDYSLEGFVANYTVENCTQGCSGHGTCKDGFCQCDKLWHGKACDLEACPLLCLEGQGQGRCNTVSFWFATAFSHCQCAKITQNCK